MRTRLSANNPHDNNRYGYVWEKVPPGEAHLDYGCYDGNFLATLAGKGIDRLVGVDLNDDALAKGRTRHLSLELIRIVPNAPLPFEDRQFSSISLMDVIEHVYDQHGIINELVRVLKPGGILLITVPRQHLFSMLDLGNLKFRFPRFHRWFYLLRHTREQYEHRFVSNPFGLIGDIEIRKRWHEHFSEKSMSELLERSNLEIQEFDGAGLFHRPLELIRAVGMHRLYRKLLKKDLAAFESTSLFCLARNPA